MNAFEPGIALVIGIDEYVGDGFDHLPTTAKDAADIARVLSSTEHCGYTTDRVVILSGTDASLFKIRVELAQIAEVSTPDSTVLIFFSGHAGSVQREGHKQVYFCPRGADLNRIEHTALSCDEFARAISAIPARNVLVVIDSSYGMDAATHTNDGATWYTGLHEVDLQSLAASRGRLVIASPLNGTPLALRPRTSRSMLAQALIAGLAGDLPQSDNGMISAFALCENLKAKMAQAQPALQPIVITRSVSDNFPIALYHGGQQATSSEPPVALPAKGARNANTVTNTKSTLGNQVVGDGSITINNSGITGESLLELLKQLKGDQL